MQDNETGEFYDNETSRNFLEIQKDTKSRQKNAFCEGFTAFIQSNSNNRILVKDTYFLYDG
jgi:hypothetical protein